VYLKAYLGLLRQTDLLPSVSQHLAILLYAHLLDKAVYEIGYELNHRLDWVRIPLRATLQLLQQGLMK
jgi:maltose alpha-D-glucosyltransferase/alpha-amylase